MHELPIVKEVLSTVLEYARANHAARVDTVVLEVGELHDLVPEWVEKFFRFASRGTIAEGAQVRIERPPLICRCSGCREHFILHLRDGSEWRCPVCGGDDFAMLTGGEFSIKEITITDE